MKKNIVSNAVELAGGIQLVAENFDISYESVRKWCVNNRVPASRVERLVSLAGGKIKHCDLRPDVFSRSYAA